MTPMTDARTPALAAAVLLASALPAAAQATNVDLDRFDVKK